jgi:hypothetical protein
VRHSLPLVTHLIRRDTYCKHCALLNAEILPGTCFNLVIIYGSTPENDDYYVWDVTPCNLVSTFHHSHQLLLSQTLFSSPCTTDRLLPLGFFFYPEDRGTSFLRNISTCAGRALPRPFLYLQLFFTKKN